jgi:TusA-related sulfurtransferase
VLCPVPIIRLARAAGTLPEGSLVELLTDDPAAEYDVPAWCRLRGHELLRTEPLGGDAPATGSAAGTGRTGPEPYAPNGNPAQALRHLIRLGGPPGMPGSPASA